MTAWRTIRVTYYADQDLLIGDAVATLFDRVRQRVDGAYFVRHWRQGPHLRLHFRCTAETFRDVIEPEAHRIVGRHLRRLPSTADLDRGHMAVLHRRLAEAENETGPLEPWIPDNTIRPMDYDSRRHVLDPLESEMLEEFFIRTTGLAFDMTRAIVDGRARAQIAFDLMVATAHALSGAGIERGLVSLRSHSEAFLTYAPEGKDLREQWAGRYKEQSPALRRRLRDVLAALDSGDDVGIPFVHRWLRDFGPLSNKARELIADGRMTLSAAETAGTVLDAPETDGAAYHDWMVLTRDSRALVETAEWFLAYRWALNCTYLQLTRIGLAPVNRYLLCTWVADAVEEEFGIAAFDVAKRLLRTAHQDPGHTPKGMP